MNLAARVDGGAQRHQFLVTDAVRQQLPDGDIEVIAVGARHLKGIAEEVDLFEVRRAGEWASKAVDPVFGMEVDVASADVRLDWAGWSMTFCSEGCLRRFVDQPDRYLAMQG